MKLKRNISALFLALAMLLSVCGCGGKTESEYTEFQSGAASSDSTDNSASGGSSAAGKTSNVQSGNKGGTTSGGTYQKPNKGSNTATDSSGNKVQLANPVYVAEGTKTMDEGLNFGGKTFTMAKRNDTAYKAASFTRLVSAFEKKYNCKIKTVELEFNTYPTLIANAKASGSPYDIIFCHGSMFPTIPLSGVVNDLSTYFSTADYDTGKGGIDIAKSSYFVIDKKLYGVVGGSDAVYPMVIYYNKQLFNKSGLEDPYELYKAGKWTWSKFREQGKKVTDAANKVYYGDTSFFDKGVVQSLGVSLLTWKNNKTVVNLENTRVIKGYQMVYDFFNKSKICSNDFSASERVQFSDGLAYCSVQETQKYSVYCEAAAQSPAFNRNAANVGVVPLPQDTASAKAGYPCGWYGAIMSGAGSSDPRVAVAFAKFWSTYTDPVADKYELNSEQKALVKKLTSGNIANLHGAYIGSDGANSSTILDFRIGLDVAKGNDVTSTINTHLPSLNAAIEYVMSKKK